jgi:hypothetical protein
VEQGKRALSAPAHEKVSLALEVLPLLVADLDRVSMYQIEVRDLRKELTQQVGNFRRLVWEGMKKNPESTFRGAEIQKCAQAIDHLLSRIQELVGP